MTEVETQPASPERETPKERLALLGYRAVGSLARALPERTGRTVFARVGTVAYHTMPRLRRTVAANQGQVLGRPPEDPLVLGSTREAFRSYARYWADTFHLADLGDEEILSRVECDTLGRLERVLERGRGAIVALPHMGNWDAAGRWMAAAGHPVVSVAEELRPRRLFELFLEHRRALSIDIIGLSGSGVGRQLAGVLARNQVVALVADRDLAGRGIEVEMFGKTRRIPAGPALLSITTGAPLHVTPVYTTPRGWRILIGEPLSVVATGDRRGDAMDLARKVAQEFERAISAAPSDWHLFQPGWPP